MKITLRKVIRDERASGFILIICTIVSLIIANSSFQEQYSHFWHTYLGNMSIEHWVNDGLMAIFFLLVGLELEREIYTGEFSRPRNAILPIAAAIGGMLVPALFYFLFNKGTSTVSGIGIPMATDIAFALAILSLLGKRVPFSLKVFLMALAVIDDLGAIVVIAVFYTKELVVSNLLIALGVYLGLIVLNRLKVYSLIPYIIGGVFMWYFMLISGVHATIAGVLLAFVIPFANRADSRNPSYYLMHKIYLPVNLIILPVFALANTAISLTSSWESLLRDSVSLGVMSGLVLGKPFGITLACFLVVSFGLSKLPVGAKWSNMLGLGCLGGIGFTMSIFISLLAFNDIAVINNAKFVVLLSSLFAGVFGYAILYFSLKRK